MRKGRQSRPLADRFWEKVRRTDGCWEWTGMRRKGYGVVLLGAGFKFTSGGAKTARAHRVSWELSNGRIPDGLCVCHKCDNPGCVRPDHLFLGTPEENIQDRHAKGRTQRGETAGRAKLTEKDVVEIRARFASGISQGQLARAYGMNQTTISGIVRRVNWRHVS